MSQSGSYTSGGGGGAGAIKTITGNTGGPQGPLGGNFDILGGANINTVGTPHTLTVNLNTSVDLPATDNAGNGLYQIGGLTVLQSYDPTNIFVGPNSGNTTLTLGVGIENSALGESTLNALTVGNNNTAVGNFALSLLTSGICSVAVGSDALIESNGDFNVAIGFAAGSQYIGVESNNISIGANVTGVTGESGTIRIGSDSDQTSCFVAGIYGVALDPMNTPLTVFVDQFGELGTSGGASAGISTIDADTGSISGTTVAINGDGVNIATAAISATDMTVSLNPIVNLPATDATHGQYQIGGTTVLQSYDPSNIFVGPNTGNLTLTLGVAINNVGVGNTSLTALTDGLYNTAVGFETLMSLTTGQASTAIGAGALLNSNGNGNVGLGFSAGSQYLGTEQFNIIIGAGNLGVTGESHTTRIGSSANQSACYIAGVYNAVLNPINSPLPVFADAFGLLGTSGGPAFVTTLDANTGSATGDPINVLGDGTGAIVTSASGSTLNIKLGNTITSNVFVGGGSGNGSVSGNGNAFVGNSSGSAISTGSNNFLGGYLVGSALDTGNNNVFLGFHAGNSIEDGNNNVIIGAAAVPTAPNAYQNMVLGASSGANWTGSEHNNILIGFAVDGNAGDIGQIIIGEPGTQVACTIAGIYGATVGATNAPVFIDDNGVLGTVGGSGGSGISTLDGDTGSATGATVTIAGDALNITTSATASTVTVSLNPIVTLPDTTSTTGQYNIGSFTVLHTFPDSQFNLFVGQAAGNFTMDGSCNQNIGVGLASLSVLATAAAQNTAVGGASLSALTTGDSNVGVGANCFGQLTGGSNNLGLGTFDLSSPTPGVGYNYTGTESNNIVIGNVGVTGDNNIIRIGTQGSGTSEQDTCFVAGIYGATVGGTNSAVFIDNNGQLGTVGGSGGSGITTLDGDGGSATGATVTLAGNGTGYITTSATGSTVSFSLGNCLGTNTFIGIGSGNQSLSGADNIGLGQVLSALTTGAANISIGSGSSGGINTGSDNIIIGNNTANGISSGSANTLIGNGAGFNYTGTENSNIILGDVVGVTSETNTIRIGNTASTKFFTTGVYGVTTGSVTTSPVIIDNNGQLGTVVSSRKFKENIKDMGEMSHNVLHLRPVTFDLRDRPSVPQQWGLIAEEVDEIFPDLVSRDDQGHPHSVRYHDMPVLLLNELKNQIKRADLLEARLIALEESFNSRTQ